MHTAQSHVWQPHSYKTIYSCGMLPVSVVHTISLMLVGEMLVKCLFLALLTQCLALENCTQEGRKTKNLTIQMQLSQTLEFDFSGYILAVELALRFINRNSCGLPDYHVSFTDIIDPQVSKKHLSPQHNMHLTFYCSEVE